MRLATLKDGTRDGTLMVVNRKGTRMTSAREIAPTLQAALDAWEETAPRLRALSIRLEGNDVPSSPVDPTRLAAPLPRAYEWIDGSAYINHILLVRRARGAEPPETLRTDPLVYQGGSGVLLGPTDELAVPDPEWGADFEAEVCVVLGDTPRGVAPQTAGSYVRLLLLANDVTFRNLVPGELAKGFGFFQSKPATAFAPFAITPDELGEHWREGRVHLPLRSKVNGALVGDPEAGPEMHFSFFDLIAHITRTRAFTAGSILGSGTISNEDPARGVSCLAERRVRELLETGSAKTPFLRPGDQVELEMLTPEGRSLFGRISQRVAAVEV